MWQLPLDVWGPALGVQDSHATSHCIARSQRRGPGPAVVWDCSGQAILCVPVLLSALGVGRLPETL